MKTILSWSSGKDAAYTLYKLSIAKQKPDLLLTTVNKDYNRVSMHGLRVELLEKQAKALQLPLYKIPLAKDVSMQTYNKTMQFHLNILKKQNYNQFVFGDIFLEDLKNYRIEQLKQVNFTAHFPLWNINTKELAVEIIQKGIKAVVITVNSKLLDQSFVGRHYNMEFLNDLPENVDWCGENGEFHTFVYDSPNFLQPIDFKLGRKTFRSYKPCSQSDQNSFKKKTNKQWDTGFWYIDVL